MKPSGNCYLLLVKFEGLRLEAYRCAAGRLTIGYGHTGNDVVEGMVITRNRALALLKSDALSTATIVDALVNVRLSQNEFDALVSFVFNIGSGAFSTSTLLRLLNGGVNRDTVAEQFDRWIYITRDGVKQVSDWQIKRRKAEKEMFLRK